MRIRMHDLAIEEIAHEVAYYEARAEGLGDALTAEINAVVALIEEFPRYSSLPR